MDMIIFEHIDVHALNSAVDKKIRTLERPHSLIFDDMLYGNVLHFHRLSLRYL